MSYLIWSSCGPSRNKTAEDHAIYYNSSRHYSLQLCEQSHNVEILVDKIRFIITCFTAVPYVDIQFQDCVYI